MAENSPRTRSTEPETQDPLQRELSKIQAFARAWKKQLIAAAALVCAVILVGAGVFYFLERARDNASARLMEITAQYESLGEDADEEALENIRQDFEHLIDQYGYTGPGKMALLQYAGMCYRTGDYGRSLELYKNAYEAFEGGSDYSHLALNGMAHANAALGEHKKAVSLFRELVDGDHQVLKDQALFNLGLLYTRTGEPEKSREAYKQIVSEFPESIFVEPARDRLSG